MIDFLWMLKSKIFRSRMSVLLTAFLLMASVLISRLFVLQIIRGADYQDNYNLRIEREEVIEATRGNIYDRNGNLLAYNRLAYAVTVEDTGTYESASKRNELLNAMFKEIIQNIEKNGDTIDTTFGIRLNARGEYEFVDSGTARQRFRADIFGHLNINELTYNRNLGLNEAEITEDEIMDYLCSDRRYNISDKEDKAMRFKIAVLRYRLGLNSYQKYLSTTIAGDVSESTVAYIKENADRLTGVNIEEKSIRVYEDAECFSNIIGYTGKISTDEYEELSEENDTYTLNDIIGKSGIEQFMNEQLMGTKGSQTIYVDSLGNLIERASYTQPVAGGDVYLSLDKDLQVNTYHLLEQEIAGILYSKIQNIKEFRTSEKTSAADIVIPITDVYFAFLDNHLIDINKLEEPDATETEKRLLSQIQSQKEQAVASLRNTLMRSGESVVYENLPEDQQEYATYLVRLLKRQEIFKSDRIDSNDENQILWQSEKMAVSDYLKYAIDKEWIDITTYMKESRYVDTDEIYESLVDYSVNQLLEDNDFGMRTSYYAILEDRITGGQLCSVLFDQGILAGDDADATKASLANGSTDAFSFVKEMVRTLQITPGQLGLDPCSGSAVIIDPQSGKTLACVSYPGYDSNRLANAVDSRYFAYLNSNKSNPLYNHATQERTAPGSTFKPVTATAGMSDHVIDPDTQIEDEGVYEKVDNHPRCWYYPSTHGSINVAGALRDSCNYFFYEVGHRLAGSLNYSDARGIERITNYATLYGLDEKTGVEVEENEPHIATEYPVMAAIGQSDNNFTTISLARYATAVANFGDVYNLTLLDHVTDEKGNTTQSFTPQLRNKVDAMDYEQWSAIHTGMRLVVEEMDIFENFPIAVAGKTGTAQQVNNRPNHALFIGYAPYDRPQIAVAARISFGYTSHNAADLTKQIMGVYFNAEGYEDRINGEASTIRSTNGATD